MQWTFKEIEAAADTPSTAVYNQVGKRPDGAEKPFVKLTPSWLFAFITCDHLDDQDFNRLAQHGSSQEISGRHSPQPSAQAKACRPGTKRRYTAMDQRPRYKGRA